MLAGAYQSDGRRGAGGCALVPAKLPERQRSALLLRSEQGLAYGEIAEVVGASVSGVKSLLHRARESLLTELKEIPE